MKKMSVNEIDEKNSVDEGDMYAWKIWVWIDEMSVNKEDELWMKKISVNEWNRYG